MHRVGSFDSFLTPSEDDHYEALHRSGPVSVSPPTSRRQSAASPHKNENCPICLDQVFLPFELSCGHTFCETCLSKTAEASCSSSCPVCRRT